MALIDTGLGWSADEDYLKQYQGLLGTISVMGGASWPEQPIPVTSNTTTDILNNGFYAAIYNSASPGNPIERQIFGAASADNPVFICHVGHTLYVLSPIRYATAYRLWRSGNSTAGGPYTINISQHSTSVPGIYNAMGIDVGSSGSNYVFNCPEFASLNDAAAALQSTIDWYKLNDGYSVSLFATYQAGDAVVTTPVMISSNVNYTALSHDGSSVAGDTYIGYYVWQGMTFAMQWGDPSVGGTVSGNTVLIRDITSAGDLSLGQDLFETIARIASITVTGASDPYQGDPNNPGGGPTEPDDTDDIPFAIPPYISASSSGFVKLFNPSLTEINSLASFMWSSGFDLDTVKRVYANPIDYIIGASIVPVIPTIKTASYPISFPGLAGSISSGVSMPEVYQYVTVSCGSITIDPKWHSYLDYSPYHRFQIWLPYIGFRDLDADDIMGKTITLQYLVDLLSGACNAELQCGGSVLYSWQGQCAAQIPINSNDWSSMMTGAISLAASAVKLGISVATGGATASSVVTDIASAGASAFNLKPSVSRGGTVAGAAGFMAQQKPYIVRTRPELALPEGMAHFAGYPSFTTVSLGSISGYAEVYADHLHGIPATEAELNEIEQILREGVIY